MRPLSDRPSSNSSSEIHSQNRYFDPIDSFDTSEDLKIKNTNLIKLVNKKYPLFKVLKKYNLSLRKVTDSGPWTHHARCPFPDHRDSNPSFGYNSKEDRFYCFGCQKSGRSVEFISFMEGMSKVRVANNLIIELNLSDLENFSDLPLDEADHGEEINNLLFEFSDVLYNLNKKYLDYPEKIKFINDISFTLDMYLYHSVSKNKVNLAELKARIEKCKEILEYLEKHE